MKNIAILGSTGSIGRQTLAVVESLPERFRVVALAGGTNLDELTGQIIRHRPRQISVADDARAAEIRERLRAAGHEPMPQIAWGREGLLSVAMDPEADILVSAAVGVVGLEATYAAV